MRRSSGADAEVLGEINHRLGVVDQLNHRVALLEDVKALLAELGPRLETAVVDREAVAGIARNLTEITAAAADRFEAMEARLEAQERRIAELVARLESR